ncbi:hypothetical protein [Rhodopseudomonas palustris]|uniref:hypothetical protein n=1 Tax=Rhodopseudomonas palustris TaxID=1076 RepID=UPI0006421FC3|nr:hypothetical protein [Rhodopseudomonas palustris]QDL96340.1 hypothetical protein FLL57_03035 [Rhodopseudomonas palustris]
MRIVPTRIHGAIDYLVSLLVLVLPFAAGGQGAVRWLFVAIGCAGIGYSLITDYEWGALRLLPMPWHLALDVVFGVALLAVGALLGFSPLGVISLVVGAAALALAAITEPEPHRASRMA